MASKTFIEIEIEQAEKFRKLLDQVINKLEKLDAGLDKVHQTTKGINFKIQGIRDLERLGAFATTFSGATNLKPFQNLVKIATYIQQANQVLKGISPTTFQSFSQAMNSLVAVDGKLGMLGNLTGFKASSLSNFSSVVTNLVTLGNKAAKMDLAGVMRLPMVINVFGDIMLKVKNFASAGTVLRGVLQAATINSLLSTIESLLRVSKLAEKVQPSSLAKISSIFLTVQTVLTALRNTAGGALTVVAARLSLLTINSLATIMTALVGVVKTASKIQPQGLVNLGYMVTSFMSVLKQFKTLGSIENVAAGLLLAMRMR